MKNHKTIYAVKPDNTSVVMIKETDKVSDLLSKIQKKEGDDEYQHIFFEGAELGNDELFFDYYEPATVYIATKEAKIPKELDCYATMKAKSGSDDEEAPTIDGFEIPEPEDVTPDDDDDNPEFVIPEPEDVKPDDDDDDDDTGSSVRKPVSKVKGSKYRIFTSLTFESMQKGNLIEGISDKMKLNDVKNIVLKWIKKEPTFKGIFEDASDIEVHLFLPCGVPFLSGTIYEWTSNLDFMVKKVLYAVVTRKLGSSSSKTYKQICDCSNDEMKLLLSPIADSTAEGYTQIASLLGYFYYGGSLPLCENLLRNLATMTGFAPMINSIYTIMVQKKVNGLMIASITSALQTFIMTKVSGSNLRTAFSYTISLLSYVNSTTIKNLPIPNLITYGYNDDDSEDDLSSAQAYLKKHGHLNYIVLWDKDSNDTEKDSFKVVKLPKPVNVKQLTDCFKSEMSLKPVSPMTILYLHSVSFIRTKKKAKSELNSKVGLFIRKKPLKGNERNIVFINPENGGETEEVDYEELADRFGDKDIDENIKSKGDTSLQQIIYVCLDTSRSMINLLNGHSKRLKSKEPSRKQLSVIFLKSLMKRIHDYCIPTARGLILFGNNKVDIKCPLSVLEGDFNKAIEDVKPDGNTPLWAAIDKAADEIIEYNPTQKVDGEDRKKYPEARGRIILLSDANDTETESDKTFKITEKLVKNRIILDVIMISTAEECRDALISSRITGGLSFRPTNEEEGIELFENEAFIDIKARATYNPIEGKITEKLFTQKDIELGRTPYATKIENRLIKQCTVNAELSSVDYTLFFRSDERYQPKSIVDRYIIKQLNRIRKAANPDIVVYTFQKELKKWRVFIKGPDGTPYENSWWNLYVSFPSNYPNSPPQFRFISIPYHQNVSGEGLLLFTQIADGYDPGHKMPALLKTIRSLFKKPDQFYILRESIEIEQAKDKASYDRKVQSAKIAKSKDDYHDYIKGVKVNEEAGIIEDEKNDLLYVTVTHHGEKHRIISGSDDDDDLIDD